jgi:hypothetical protein
MLSSVDFEKMSSSPHNHGHNKGNTCLVDTLRGQDTQVIASWCFAAFYGGLVAILHHIDKVVILTELMY